MRVFLAIDLDDAARRVAATWAQDLSARLGASAREIKWVETPNLHLSVHFFGELKDEQLAAVRQALAVPFDARAFALTLTGGGTFPPSGWARVIWLGVRERDGAGLVQSIYDDVQSRLAPLGLQEESMRGFTPHLTIGRVRTPAGPLSRTLRAVLQAAPLPSAPDFVVDHLTFYQSKLSPKGPTYLPIEHYALSRRSG
jgi:RNA 2',3'-cyclic 3'-phosphodiesterase